MGSQTRCLVWRHGDIGRNELAIPSALRIGTTPVDLEVWIRSLAVEDLARWLHSRLHGLAILLLQLRHVRRRIRRGEIRLAILKMLDLARRVLRAHEAAVEAAHLVTFRRRVLVLEFGLECSQYKILG